MLHIPQFFAMNLFAMKRARVSRTVFPGRMFLYPCLFDSKPISRKFSWVNSELLLLTGHKGQYYFLEKGFAFNRNLFIVFHFSRQSKIHLFSLSPPTYYCKAATLTSNARVLSGTGIPVGTSRRKKEMGKFPMSWCVIDLAIFIWLL